MLLNTLTMRYKRESAFIILKM